MKRSKALCVKGLLKVLYCGINSNESCDGGSNNKDNKKRNAMIENIQTVKPLMHQFTVTITVSTSHIIKIQQQTSGP